MSAPVAPTVPEAGADGHRRHVATLLERCAERDERALEELYRLTSARLFGVAVRLLRQEPLAEEMPQEAFLKIWRNAARCSSETRSPSASSPKAARRSPCRQGRSCIKVT